MPLDEDGAKWSCEPCVRGHRSSKCQHFDRLMMKVPKAGRPLAKCPHPKGSCSCKKTFAFMVRIPKGSSCLCRPLYQVPVTSGESAADNAASSANVSPPLGSGKIQKHSQRQNGVQIRPKSVLKVLDMDNDNTTIGVPEGQSSSPSAQQSHPNSSSTNSVYSTFLPERSSHSTGSDKVAGSCCSGVTAPNPTTQPLASCCDERPPPAEKSIVDVKKQGSCCGNSDGVGVQSVSGQQPNYATDWENGSSHGIYDNSRWTGPQNFMLPLFQDPLVRNSQMSLDYRNGNSFADTTNHGSVLGTDNALSFATVSSTNGNEYSFYSSTSLPSEALEECSCGDGCQCLGCATHPFNSTTRQHVQEMGYMMSVTEDEVNSDQASPFALSPTTYPKPLSTDIPTAVQSLPPDGTHFTSTSTAESSNSTYDSNGIPNATNQLMHPSEYYTLEYPVGLPSACSNMYGTCQCGSDCCCVGCLTHSGHNGVLLEEQSAADITPQNDSDHTNADHTFGAEVDFKLAQSPTIDDFLFSTYSPPAVKTSSS